MKRKSDYMQIVLDPRKSLVQNAAFYHEEAKKWRAKAEGARKAVADTLRLKQEKQGEKAGTMTREKRHWFEAFHWFKTSEGSLVIGGKNAKQNDLVFSKHAVPEEWFLHADIRGAPAVVVKNSRATDHELLQAAQFAASYSSAWKRGFGSIDVYAVKAGQVSKHVTGGYLGQGAFAITGQRKWFKNTLLGLYLCLDNGKIFARPVQSGGIGVFVEIKPGSEDKQRVSKAIKAYFAKKLFEKGRKLVLEDELEGLLPGKSDVVL
ncbi:DUF814 domain-containing protein [Candidatus Micrarchaeota archaeon]|nr:DUF814 domain-containing protein [Candidatus Micrarchaeota archaeon]